jgi:hypothetical protein
MVPFLSPVLSREGKPALMTKSNLGILGGSDLYVGLKRLITEG